MNNQQRIKALFICVGMLTGVFVSVFGFAKPVTEVNASSTKHAVDFESDAKDRTALASEAVDPEADTGNSTDSENTLDPYEKFNRVMYRFNDYIDIYILKPVATLYNKIMPKPLNQGVHNFFTNLGEVTVIGNDILQANFTQMANDAWRFTINSTIGVAGLFDVATRLNLPYYSNDFGLTLARWGYKESNYLVLPFFGPNTIRDGLSLPVDYYAFTPYPYIHPRSTRYGIYALGVVDRRAQLLQYQSVFEEAAIDKYVFLRTAYMQRRRYKMEENARGGNWQTLLPDKSPSPEQNDKNRD